MNNINKFKSFYFKKEDEQWYIKYHKGIEYAFVQGEKSWFLAEIKIRKMSWVGFFNPEKTRYQEYVDAEFVSSTEKKLNKKDKGYYSIGDNLPAFLF